MLTFSLFRRELAILFSLCLVLVLAADTVTSRAAVAQPGSEAAELDPNCEAEYRILDQRPDTFTGMVIIRGSSYFDLDWTFTAGQRITRLWNGHLRNAGPQVSMEVESANAAPHATATVRFEATWNGVDNPVPNNISIGSGPCRVPAPPPSFDDCGQRRAHAEVSFSRGLWVTRHHRGTLVYEGTSMRDAIQAGVDALTPGRTAKEVVLVHDPGELDPSEPVRLASYTVLEACGTITPTQSGWGISPPITAVEVEEVEISYLAVTSYGFGLLLSNVTGGVLGRIEASVRIDNAADPTSRSRKLEINHVEVADAEYGLYLDGVEGVSIGTVRSHEIDRATLRMLNTIHASVHTVEGRVLDGDFNRPVVWITDQSGVTANDSPPNIQLGTIIARGATGLACRLSGGITVERIDVTDHHYNSISLASCHDVTVATDYGTVIDTWVDERNSRGVGVYTSSGSDPPRDITISNLYLENTLAVWVPCAGDNIRLTHVEAVDVTMYWCADRVPGP